MRTVPTDKPTAIKTEQPYEPTAQEKSGVIYNGNLYDTQPQGNKAQHSPTFDEACSHPAIKEVLAERDSLKAHAAQLAEALDLLLRLADRAGLCPQDESRGEMDNARKALAAYEAAQ